MGGVLREPALSFRLGHRKTSDSIRAVNGAQSRPEHGVIMIMIMIMTARLLFAGSVALHRSGGFVTIQNVYQTASGLPLKNLQSW